MSKNNETKELEILLKEGEGLTVEFKEKYTSKIDRDIVALSNSKGGFILLGVNDEGKAVGEKLTNQMKAEILSLARNCEPHISISKISQLDNVVVIDVPEGNEKPYSCSSGYFRRLDAVTQKMTQTEIRSVFKEKNSVSFESLSTGNFKLEDISLKKMSLFLSESKTSLRVTNNNLESVLTSLEIMDNKKINNAGVLMFARNVGRFIPYAELVCGAFKGTNKTYIYDRKDIRDDLFAQLNEAMSFIKKHINIRSEIREINRYDIYEIPLDALREAVVNAIVHRDYNMRGTNISVNIFDDRVEIVNPGGIPEGLSKANFGKESFRRNLIIADLFHRMDKMEKIGSGILRMRELMENAKLKEPTFESNTFFRATFYRNPEYSLKGTEKVTVKDTEKDTVKDTEKDTVHFTKNEEVILKKIKINPYITAEELSKTLKINIRNTKKYLSKLKKNKFLERFGPDKGGHWEIVKGGKKE